MAAEKQLKANEDELATAHAELLKLHSDKEDLIDEYMDSQKFKNLMEVHDEGLYLTHFTTGWDQAVEAILEEQHGMFDAKDL